MKIFKRKGRCAFCGKPIGFSESGGVAYNWRGVLWTPLHFECMGKIRKLEENEPKTFSSTYSASSYLSLTSSWSGVARPEKQWVDEDGVIWAESEKGYKQRKPDIYREGEKQEIKKYKRELEF